tara:strand:- start:452 stop:859 length:408 start_codon:yes stop_codon:yes gene_type:complete
MYSLRSSAKSFTPGAINHIIKRVSWHKHGITDVKEFNVTYEECLARGRETPIKYGLHKIEDSLHSSKIRANNEEEAVPFKEINYISDNFTDNSEDIIPDISPVYTSPLYHTNTSKDVYLYPLTNITLRRYNYCDN